jgi:hypothetical protein
MRHPPHPLDFSGLEDGVPLFSTLFRQSDDDDIEGRRAVDLRELVGTARRVVKNRQSTAGVGIYGESPNQICRQCCNRVGKSGEHSKPG